MRKSMKRSLLLQLFIIAAVSMVIGFGCGKDTKDPAVAKIGGDEIAISVVNNFFDKIGATFTSADEEYQAKRDALDSLIDFKLLIKGAYAAGLDKDAEVDQLVNSEKSSFMFDELYRQEIVPKLTVSDKEIDDFYEKMKVEYHLAHILVTTQKEADSISAELKKGADFGGIARAVSLDQESAVRGGDLGFVSWATQVDPEFRDAAFSMHAGQTSDPIKTGYGWHIIRVLETRDSKQISPKAQMVSPIRELLKSRKSSEIEAEFMKQMEEKAKVEINPEATQMLLTRLDEFYPKNVAGAARPDNFFPQTNLLKPFELQMVFASYQGGEVTVEDYLKKIANVAEAYRPRFDNPDSLKKVIFQIELRNIMEYEAAQRNVEQQPEYQQRMNDFREGLMADRFVRSILSRNINVDEAEINQYYNSHFEEFMTPRELHLLEIEVDSSEQAERVIDQLNTGVDFGNLAAKYTVRAGFKEKKGDLGFIQPGKYPKLYEAASNLIKGQISKLIVNDDEKYSIVKLIDTKESVAMPVENVSSQVKQKVIALKRSSATADWLKDQRSKIDIKVYEDVIRQSIDKKKYEKS
jgi:peptidyl-prolyl cis-trans isomerase C